MLNTICSTLLRVVVVIPWGGKVDISALRPSSLPGSRPRPPHTHNAPVAKTNWVARDPVPIYI